MPLIAIFKAVGRILADKLLTTINAVVTPIVTAFFTVGKSVAVAAFVAAIIILLSGTASTPSAHAAKLPNCKSNPGCLWKLKKYKWKRITSPEVQFMIDRGADVNAKGGKYGWTPLHKAIIVGNTQIIPVLIKAGADVNSDYYGDTPLHLVVGQNNEVILILIKAGADVNATDNHGMTPLDWAKRYNDPEAIEYLSSGSQLASPNCFNIIRSKPNQIIRVNGVAMTLLIDTGASATHLTKQQARSAGVRITGKSQFTLADGSVVVNKTGSANISLGGGLSGDFPVSIGKGTGLLGRDVLDEFACR